MISLLLPTRNRPDGLARFVESARGTATDPTRVEIVVYIDDDDDAYDSLDLDIRTVRGPRLVLSELWNRCFENATGDIVGHMGDDLVFRTVGWDQLIEDAFAAVPDRICFVHGWDGDPNHHSPPFGTHGFVHRRWVDTVGRFVPPYFSSDFNDTWLNDVVDQIGRRVYLPHLYTEHLHPAFGKAPLDQTHQERLARGAADNVGAIYYSAPMYAERGADAGKLRAAIDAHQAETELP